MTTRRHWVAFAFIAVGFLALVGGYPMGKDLAARDDAPHAHP